MSRKSRMWAIIGDAFEAARRPAAQGVPGRAAYGPCSRPERRRGSHPERARPVRHGPWSRWARWSVEALLSTPRVLSRGLSFASGVLELLSRISMITARTPIAITPRPHSREVLLRGFRRCPQSAPREPLHLGVRMLVSNAVERWQKVSALRCTKGSGQAAGQDRPVRVSGWHRVPSRSGNDAQSCPSLLSFSTSVVRLMRSSSAALLRLPPVRSSER